MTIPVNNIILLLFLFFATPLLAQNDTLKADQFYSQGKALYYDGEYKKSIKSFRKALALRQKIYGEAHEEIWKVYLRMGKANRRLRSHKNGLIELNKALALAQKTDGENSIAVAEIYHEIGYIYAQMYQPKKANQYYNKIRIIYEAKYGKESSKVGNIYMDFGNTSIKMGNYFDADAYYQKAHEIFKKSSKPTDKDFYRIYNNHGILFRKTGDYERSMTYAKKALEIKLLHYDPNHESVAKYHANIGNLYKDLGDYETALSYFTKAVEIRVKSLGKNHPETAGTYGAQADMYAELGQFKKALKLYKKATKIQEKTLRPGHPYLLAGYFNVGMTYEDMKDYDKALDYYQTTLDKFVNNVYTPGKLFAETQQRIAAVHFAKGDIQAALLSIRAGIAQLVSDFNYREQDVYSNPGLETVQSELEFLDLLHSKSSFLEGSFKETNQRKDLDEALNTSLLAINLIERMRRGYQSESAKKFLNADTAPIYERTVNQAFQLYELSKDPNYLYKAFEVSEKSKASILWQNLNTQYALESETIPFSISDSLQSLHDQIASLEYDIQQVEDSLRQRSLRDQILDLKLTYEGRIRDLEKDNPDYFQLKYAPATADATVVINNLPSDQSAVVEYFYDERNLFVFICTKAGLKGYRLKISFDLDQTILAFRQVDIHQLLLDQKQARQYIATLNQLHQLLIEPISPQLEHIQNLVFIPHGVLQLLSFEMLAPASPNIDFRSLDYLVRSYTIQYAWSAALWANTRQRPINSNNKFAGFAPGFDMEKTTAIAAAHSFVFRNGLAPLKYSIPEVEAANNYFPGKVFTASAASEAQFLEVAPQSKIIHLATHAMANDRFPLQSGLLFYTEVESKEDGFLNTSEIYNLKLNAELAVMSACNTGYGQLAKGEGVMSLGRAFLHAGCKSIVMSLWLANDQSTSTIMQYFYKHSAEGCSKDEALRKAKLAYLKNADALTAHPYFWANLVAVGDMKPLAKKGMSLGWLVLLLAMGAGLLFWSRTGR